MIKFVIGLVIMTILGAFGGYHFKLIAETNDKYPCFVLNPNLYIGGILYFISALLNIVLLKHIDYTIVLPATSITYIWTMILSHRHLGDNINHKKIIGVILIMLGTTLISV